MFYFYILEPSNEPEEQNGDIPGDKRGSKSKKTKKSEEEIPKTSQEAETKPKKGRTRKASSEGIHISKYFL